MSAHSLTPEAILQQRITEMELKPTPPGPSSLPAAEVRKLRKERDSLKDAISSFEVELLQIQMDTKTLAEDRDNFKLLYEQVIESMSSVSVWLIIMSL